MAKTKIKLEGIYGSLNVTKQGTQKLKFFLSYEELPKTLMLAGGLLLDCKLYVKPESYSKKKAIGTVRIGSINIGKEGEAKVEFYGENLDIPSMNDLVDSLIEMFIVYEEEEELDDDEEEYEGDEYDEEIDYEEEEDE